MVLSSRSPLKRSSTSLDLMAIEHDDMLPLQPEKSLSSIVFGWDHYGACEGITYHSWRDKKRPRRDHGGTEQSPDSFNIQVAVQRQGPSLSGQCIRDDAIRWPKLSTSLSSNFSCGTNDSSENISFQSKPQPVNDVTDMLAIASL